MVVCSAFCNDIPWTMHHLFIRLDQLIFSIVSVHSGIVLARIQSSSASYFFSLMHKMLVILQSLWRHADHFCNLFKMVVILISILLKELSFTSCLSDFCYAINSTFLFPLPFWFHYILIISWATYRFIYFYFSKKWQRYTELQQFFILYMVLIMIFKHVFIRFCSFLYVRMWFGNVKSIWLESLLLLHASLWCSESWFILLIISIMQQGTPSASLQEGIIHPTMLWWTTEWSN